MNIIQPKLINMENFRKLSYENIKAELPNIKDNEVLLTEKKSLSLDKNNLANKIKELEQKIFDGKMEVLNRREELENLKIDPYEDTDYLNLVKKVDELTDEKNKLMESN